MNEELRKRLEEAADEHCSKYDFEPTQRNITDSGWEYGHTYTQLVKCFLAGAEHGYKEAIAQAKEWLEKKTRFAKAQYCNCEDNEDDYYNGKANGLEAALADFETDMNKLWEEEK